MTDKGWIPERDFTDAPTLCKMIEDDNFVQIAVGPVGSGKTFMLCNKVMMKSMQQQPCKKDNIRYTRWVFVRNTMPELRTTTMKTWEQCWPPEHCGPIVWHSPPSHHIRVAPTDTEPGLDIEVLFIALDRPRDVKKALSLEVTGFIFNEVRETPKALFDIVTSRIGRYPGKLRGPTTWSGILADTNPPDEDHYLTDWQLNPPKNYSIYRQPGAVIEVEIKDGLPIAVDEWCRGDTFPHHPLHKDKPMPIIRNKNAAFVVNPKAENLHNLQDAAPTKDVYGPDGYYGRQIAGKNSDYIHVYLKGLDGYVREGKPVIPEFNKAMMIVPDLPILTDRPIIMGLDIGGGTLSPAGIWMQQHVYGTWLIHQEIMCNDMGVERFSELLKTVHMETFNAPIVTAWGDPAGAKRDDLYETMIFDHLVKAGIPAKSAPSQAILARIDAIKRPMNRLIEGKPGFLIHPRCKNLIKGLAGRWFYKRLQILDREAYTDKPDKGFYSHPCDALGYGLLGGGEYRSMVGRDQDDAKWGGQPQAKSFNPFDKQI